MFFLKIFTAKSIVIYIFIADYFVNEIFGDNMITPVHIIVHSLYGLFFSRKYAVPGDECIGMSGIIGLFCTARDVRSGDTINRWCAVSAVACTTGEIEVAG